MECPNCGDSNWERLGEGWWSCGTCGHEQEQPVEEEVDNGIISEEAFANMYD